MTSKEGLKWRCRKHPNVSCDFLCLNGDSKDRVMCFDCVQEQLIPASNLISIKNVLAAKEHDILQVYPPLKDQELSDKIRNVNQQSSVEEMDSYFKNLREEFEKEMLLAQEQAKKYQQQEEKAKQPLYQEYKKIAEIEKLKQLIMSDKEGAANDLDTFIKEKWTKAEENKLILQKLLKNYEDRLRCDQSDEPNSIPLKMIESLKKMDFFNKPISILSQITLIKSTFKTSQQMEVTKVNNSIYQVKQLAYSGYFDQVFVDPIIDPLKKYILHLELEQKPGSSGNYFFFGLAKDEGKDNNYAFSQNLSFYDHSNSYGITKYIKGSPMQSGSKVIGKHSFEVRIHLNKKFLRVACLPDYSSIAELDDPDKIDPKVDYRFFFSMCNEGDIMRITNVRTVSEFDVEM